jgi:hypothetical protein
VNRCTVKHIHGENTAKQIDRREGRGCVYACACACVCARICVRTGYHNAKDGKARNVTCPSLSSWPILMILAGFTSLQSLSFSLSLLSLSLSLFQHPTPSHPYKPVYACLVPSLLRSVISPNYPSQGLSYTYTYTDTHTHECTNARLHTRAHVEISHP